MKINEVRTVIKNSKLSCWPWNDNHQVDKRPITMDAVNGQSEVKTEL